MPNIKAVLGAGGKTGKACVETLLEEGYSVRAVVRDVDKYKSTFPQNNPSLEVLPGDVTDQASLKTVLSGCDGVIFAASGKGYWSAKDVDYMGVENTCTAAKSVGGIQHVVLVSSCLVTPTWTNKFNPIRILLNNMRYSLMDYKYKGEEVLRKSGLTYTVVRPGGLINEPAGKATLLARQGDTGAGRVSRSDVAAVCVAALTDPAATNVTLELVSDSTVRDGGIVPLKEQLRGLFRGLKPDNYVK